MIPFLVSIFAHLSTSMYNSGGAYAMFTQVSGTSLIPAEEIFEAKPTLYMEYAGIFTIEPEKRDQALELVDKVLGDQPAVPGPTKLIKHKIQLTYDGIFETFSTNGETNRAITITQVHR